MRRGTLLVALLLLAGRSTDAAAEEAFRPVRVPVAEPVRKVRAVARDGALDVLLVLTAPTQSSAPTVLVKTGPRTFTEIPGLGSPPAVAILRRKEAPGWVPQALTDALPARSPGEPLAFWDHVLDADGDGEEEVVLPGADGRTTVGGVAIDLPLSNEVNRNDADLFQRDAKVPTLQAADLDGDGKKELVALVGTDLLVWMRGEKGAWARARAVPIPFLAPDPKRPAEEIRTPRINVVDADGDGKADLLVTLVQGRADKVGGLRTSLYRFPGPFFDAKTGALVEPQPRIDTESVALHPRFVDVDGDGRLDYVADSIRGTMLDLIARVMGREPTIWHTVFRFDPKAGAYEKKPFASVERPYSADEAKGNTFGRSGFFEGDFDGDGVKDLLDLGNLTNVTILAGTRSGEGAFEREILPTTKLEKPVKADAVIADLDGDGKSDAVLWDEDGLVLLVSGGEKKK